MKIENIKKLLEQKKIYIKSEYSSHFRSEK